MAPGASVGKTGKPISRDFLPEEVMDEGRDIGLSLPEWRQWDREDVEPEPEVLPELVLLHHGLEVPVGRGDDPDVHLYGGSAAHPFEFLRLQHPQEPHLSIAGSSPISSRKIVPLSARSKRPLF